MFQHQITHFFDLVAGIPHPNRDGSNRLQIALECKPCEQLDLVPEPDNPSDSNAIAVLRENGQQVGYLPTELAAIVTYEIAQRWKYVAFVWSLGDDTPPYTVFGIELVILRISPGTTDAEVRAYIDETSDWRATNTRPSPVAVSQTPTPAVCVPTRQPGVWPHPAS